MEENSFIVQLQQAGGGGWLWLGGHDIVEDTWVWTDGAQWGFTNWKMAPDGRYLAPDNGDMVTKNASHSRRILTKEVRMVGRTACL